MNNNATHSETIEKIGFNVGLSPEMPKPTMQPVPQPQPLSFEAVQRILRKARFDSDHSLFFDKEVRWFKEEDGTTYGIFEDSETAVRYKWTVDPKTFKPVHFGPVNE